MWKCAVTATLCNFLVNLGIKHQHHFSSFAGEHFGIHLWRSRFHMISLCHVLFPHAKNLIHMWIHIPGLSKFHFKPENSQSSVKSQVSPCDIFCKDSVRQRCEGEKRTARSCAEDRVTFQSPLRPPAALPQRQTELLIIHHRVKEHTITDHLR